MWSPTVEEQIAIATVLSDLDAEIAALETRFAKARLHQAGHDAGTADRADSAGLNGSAAILAASSVLLTFIGNPINYPGQNKTS